MDWIGEDQLQMLDEGKKNALQERLDKLVEIIERKGKDGEITVRELRKCHGSFDDDQISLIVESFPNVVQKTEKKPAQGFRCDGPASCGMTPFGSFGGGCVSFDDFRYRSVNGYS